MYYVDCIMPLRRFLALTTHRVSFNPAPTSFSISVRPSRAIGNDATSSTQPHAVELFGKERTLLGQLAI